MLMIFEILKFYSLVTWYMARQENFVEYAEIELLFETKD